MSLVLVVDDEPAVLEVLTEVVEDLGHDVVRAHDGREALMLARAQHPNLVVTDHMMPRLSGVELCRALRDDDSLKTVPVILLSAALPPEANEANAYLAKPFELDEFEALVKRTLDGAQAQVAAAHAEQPPPRPPDAPPEELINWVAHEMKTPLAAAKMNLQLLERKVTTNGQPPEKHHFLSVTRQLENLEQIVNGLLDASRLAEGNLQLSMERGDLRRTVEAVIGHWRELHPDFRFELVLPNEEVAVKHDPARMAQILGNLLANAVRFGAPPKHVRVELAILGALAELRVQDFGPGIPAAAQRNIFQRFRGSEEGRGKGHGLGLFVSSELTRLHGGVLNVRSLLGQGTTFTMTLPLAG